MVKKFSLIFLLMLASFTLAAQQELSDSSDPKAPNIVVVGCDVSKTKWLVRTAESKFNVMLYDMKTRQIRRFPIDEENVLSAQFMSIPYIKGPLIEIVSGTNEGLGKIYLFDMNMRPLLHTKYVDSHREVIDYSIYCKLKIYAKFGDAKTPISRIYRNNHLNVAYDADIKTKTIKLSGYCDYLTPFESSESIVYTEYVEKSFRYSDTTKEFVYQAGESFPENESWLSD